MSRRPAGAIRRARQTRQVELGRETGLSSVTVPGGAVVGYRRRQLAGAETPGGVAPMAAARATSSARVAVDMDRFLGLAVIRPAPIPGPSRTVPIQPVIEARAREVAP